MALGPALITVHVDLPDGQRRSLQAPVGRSLMRVATDAGIDSIAADCGGTCSCATCHVIVATEWLALLPAATDEEAAMLDMTAAPREPGSRLSCCINLSAALDGLAVRVATTQY